MCNYYAGLIEDGENVLSRRGLLSDLPTPTWGWLYIAGVCSRGMVMHPFYVHGLSLWGAKSRLSEPQGQQPEYDRAMFAPPSEDELAEMETYHSSDEFLAAVGART